MLNCFLSSLKNSFHVQFANAGFGLVNTNASNTILEADLSGQWLSRDRSIWVEIVDNDDVYISYNGQEQLELSLMEEDEKLTIEGYLEEDNKYEIISFSSGILKIKDVKSNREIYLKKQD